MLRRIKRRKLWLVPIVALNLVPVAAWGDSTAPATVSKPRDLTLAQVQGAVSDFRVVKNGRDPNSTLSLKGVVFAECGLKISKVSDPAKRYVGYRFQDTTGKAASCMEELKSQGHDCESKACVSLSSQSTLVHDFTNEPDLEFKVLRIDTMKDPKEQWDTLTAKDGKGEDVTKFKSGGSIRREAEAEKEAETAREIARHRRNIKGCRGSVTALEQWETSLQYLYDSNEIAQDVYDKDMKKLRQERFNILMKNFSKVKPGDLGEMQDVMSELNAFSEDDKLAHGIADAYANKAKAMISAKKAGPEAYDDASWMIGEAQQISSLSDADQTMLRKYQRELKVGSFAKQAKSGSPDFFDDYQSYLWELQSEVQDACTGYDASNFGECQSLMSTFQAAQQVPSVYQQAQYERYMFQMQMRQAMASFQQNPMGSSSLGGMSMLGGGMNPMGAMPMAGMPQNPQFSQYPQYPMNGMQMGQMMPQRF